ncbi:hypothetical protein M9458_055378, partial [Cirrhinus mrigala]
DLEGLIARLPDIHEGAGKWIKTFEEETMGKLLAVGDIKALLAKILGGTKIDEVLKASDLERAVDFCYMDGTVFDSYRPVVWQTLRAEYPTRVDPKALKGDHLGEIESPIIYIQKQLKRWKQETEGNPEGDPLMATLFRNAIVDAMPQPVKSKLEDVVGLYSKTHKEFCDQVVHAVEQYRRNEQKLKNQEKELQKKLTQLQLEELINKNKKKIQATVKRDDAEQMTVVNAASASPSAVQLTHAPAVQMTPPARILPNAFQTPTPIIHIHAQPPGVMQNGRRMVQVNPTHKGGPGEFPEECWKCGQWGHSRRRCPLGSWTQPVGKGRGGWRRPLQGPPQGSTYSTVNHWGGSKQGY